MLVIRYLLGGFPMRSKRIFKSILVLISVTVLMSNMSLAAIKVTKTAPVITPSLQLIQMVM
jgi:hypothetical protein